MLKNIHPNRVEKLQDIFDRVVAAYKDAKQLVSESDEPSYGVTIVLKDLGDAKIVLNYYHETFYFGLKHEPILSQPLSKELENEYKKSFPEPRNMHTINKSAIERWIDYLEQFWVWFHVNASLQRAEQDAEKKAFFEKLRTDGFVIRDSMSSADGSAYFDSDLIELRVRWEGNIPGSKLYDRREAIVKDWSDVRRLTQGCIQKTDAPVIHIAYTAELAGKVKVTRHNRQSWTIEVVATGEVIEYDEHCPHDPKTEDSAWVKWLSDIKKTQEKIKAVCQ
jgi:hypothetical protein